MYYTRTRSRVGLTFKSRDGRACLLRIYWRHIRRETRGLRIVYGDTHNGYTPGTEFTRLRKSETRYSTYACIRAEYLLILTYTVYGKTRYTHTRAHGCSPRKHTRAGRDESQEPELIAYIILLLYGRVHASQCRRVLATQ